MVVWLWLWLCVWSARISLMPYACPIMHAMHSQDSERKGAPSFFPRLREEGGAPLRLEACAHISYAHGLPPTVISGVFGRLDRSDSTRTSFWPWLRNTAIRLRTTLSGCCFNSTDSFVAVRVGISEIGLTGLHAHSALHREDQPRQSTPFLCHNVGKRG